MLFGGGMVPYWWSYTDTKVMLPPLIPPNIYKLRFFSYLFHRYEDFPSQVRKRMSASAIGTICEQIYKAATYTCFPLQSLNG